MNAITRKKFRLVMASTIRTTDGAGGDGGQNNDGAGDQGGQSGDGGQADDLSTLFTAEDIQARKESIAASKAEEERRAALTDEQRAAEDQAKADAEAANQVPENYADFKVPEGVILDPEMMGEFNPLAKELGLTQDKAQKLIDLATKMQQRTMDGIFAAHEQRKAAWLEEAQNDKEIGADIKLGPEKSHTYRAFQTIAGNRPDIKAMVDETGIGNHPAFLRLFYDLSQKMREDTFVTPGTAGEGEAKSIAKALWPGMN